MSLYTRNPVSGDFFTSEDTSQAINVHLLKATEYSSRQQMFDQTAQADQALLEACDTKQFSQITAHILLNQYVLFIQLCLSDLFLN